VRHHWNHVHFHTFKKEPNDDQMVIHGVQVEKLILSHAESEVYKMRIAQRVTFYDGEYNKATNPFAQVNKKE